MQTTFRLGLIASLATLLLNPVFAAEPGTQPPGDTLEDFFTSALDFNPELNIARESWNIGTARRNQINGQLLPQINANANLSENTRESTTQPELSYDGERYTLQLSQVLFNWQAFAARSAAYLVEDQAEAEYYAQLAQLLTEVADRYLIALQAEDDLESVTAELEATSNQVDRVQMLYDLEIARVTDLYESQARLAAVRSDLVTMESNLTLARESLRAISGLEVGDLARLPDEITVQPVEGALEEWLERARNNNQTIEARGFALRAAEKRVSEQRGAYLPRVSLVYQRQQSNVGYDNMPLTQSLDRIDTDYIGVDFSIPLFAGGSNRARVREAYSMKNIAESELRQAELEIVEQTRTAFLQAKAGEARIEAGRALAESTTTSHEAMERGFELGTVTTVDVLDALRDRFSAERDLQRARYDHIRAQLMLRREAGQLTADDLREISNQLSER
jgi:outer membrane protein